jgi:hypothetical protein
MSITSAGNFFGVGRDLGPRERAYIDSHHMLLEGCRAGRTPSYADIERADIEAQRQGKLHGSGEQRLFPNAPGYPSRDSYR